MRTKYLFGLNLILLCALGFVSCGNEEEEGRKITDYKEYVLVVASKKIPGVRWSDGFNYLTDVYAVKKENAEEWESLGFIDGLEFEEGFEYQIRISETNYLDYRMGQPAWTEHELLEVISKREKASGGLPLHFIPGWYYKDQSIPEYRYAVEADNKEPIEEDLKVNSILPLKSRYLIYGTGGSPIEWKWIIMYDANGILGKGVLKKVNKNHEEFPESYRILIPEKIYGYMEWTFLDESGNEAIYPPFDVFLTEDSKTRSDYVPKLTPRLYYDLTEYYKKKYPEAGVKTVVVSYTIDI